MDRIADLPIDEMSPNASSENQEAVWSKASQQEWQGHHPINLRATLPLPFGRWYVTLVAGPERRRRERLTEDRKKHPLDTLPNLMFLLSIGIISTALLLTIAALVLIHGYGWSVELTIP